MAFNCTLTLCNDTRVVYTAPNGGKFGADIVLNDLTSKLINRLNVLAGEDRCDREDLELLGEFLYQVLLPTGDGSAQNQNLREQVQRDYAFFLANRRQEDRFRVTLELHKDARTLAKFPWEFLFMPVSESSVDGFFLAGEKTELILTRFVPNLPAETNMKTEEPLRILVVFSHPRELGDIKSKVTEEVITTIEALSGLGRIEVRVEDNPTHNHLSELLNGKDVIGDEAKPPAERERFRPDIFHFIGHGEPNKIALIRKEADIKAGEEETGERIEADWCDTAQVLKLFSNHTPRLVFLHACDGAKAKSVESLSDLARELVYGKIPVVIAMQYTIKNKDAALFAKTFYEEIRNNSEIDEAVRVGREALGQKQDKKGSWSDRRFGTPVVYLQKNSQRALVNFPSTRPTGGLPYDSQKVVRCPNVDCPRNVLQGNAFCTACRHSIGMCPNCASDKNEWNLMDKTAGICGRCGYQPVEKNVGASPSGRGATDSGWRPGSQSADAPTLAPSGNWQEPTSPPRKQFDLGPKGT